MCHIDNTEKEEEEEEERHKERNNKKHFFYKTKDIKLFKDSGALALVFISSSFFDTAEKTNTSQLHLLNLDPI